MDSKWYTTTLGEVLELKRGYDLPKKKRKAGQIPIISSSGYSDVHADSKVTGPGVVTGRYGTIGQVFWIEEDFWPLNTTLYVRDFKGNDPRFISYFLKTIDFLSYSDKAAVPGVNRNHLHLAQVTIPDVNTQRQIAHILDTLDHKIELNRQMNQTLEAMAQAIFKSWFVDFEPVKAKQQAREAGESVELAAMVAIAGKSAAEIEQLPAAQRASLAETADLFPDRLVESELGPIPEGWSYKKIKECCLRIQNGGTPQRSESQFWENGDIPWLSSSEVRQEIVIETSRFITEKGFKNSSAKWVPALSTVVALYGATAGQTALISEALTTNQAVCALIPKPGFARFNYLAMRRESEMIATKAVGSAQQNLSKKIVENTTLLLPKESLVQHLDGYLDDFFRQWILHLNQSRTLSQLRDTLLPKLLSGELTISDAMPQAEEALT